MHRQKQVSELSPLEKKIVMGELRTNFDNAANVKELFNNLLFEWLETEHADEHQHRNDMLFLRHCILADTENVLFAE